MTCLNIVSCHCPISPQDHYDFGMRAVKTVISAAGNIKREYPDLDEVMTHP